MPLQRADLRLKTLAYHDFSVRDLLGEPHDSFIDITIRVANARDESDARDRVIALLRRVHVVMSGDDFGTD